jgi:carbon-monoxide dehydrogenase small subunit
MKTLVELHINDRDYIVYVEPCRTLLEVIREDLGFTGTKDGCGSGDCGACTVIMAGRAVNSCLVLAIRAQGKKILTIEGLSQNGELHPLQTAFIKYGAIQCGYCTPGMILSAKALLDENPTPDEIQIRRALSGNLCRCTGYKKIVAAIQEVAMELQGGELALHEKE